MGVYKLANGGYRTTYDARIENEIILPAKRESKKLIVDLIEIQDSLNHLVEPSDVISVVIQESRNPPHIVEESFNELLESGKIVIENHSVHLK